MKRINFLIQLVVGLFAFAFMTMVQAADEPLWAFATVDGYPPTLTISKTDTKTIKYTVTNQTTKRRTLVMQPQVGVSQEQPCTVGPKGSTTSSCTLTLTVSGGLLPPAGISGGPKLCQANPNGTPNPGQCYQPNAANILNIKVTPGASLVSIDVTPMNLAIAQGLTQQYTATGIYSDGTTKDLTSSVNWSSSNTSIATISSTTGLAEGIAQGTVTITATSGTVSGTTNLTVTTAKLQSIVVKPTIRQIAEGTTQQFIAVGIFTDGSTHNITSSVIWRSSSPTIATISNSRGSNGLATGRSAGLVTITATLGTISGSANLNVTNAVLTSIDVTPVSSAIAQGITQQFTATGVFSDNTTQDLTSSVNWFSSNTNITTISNAGLATGVSQGTVTITATSGTVSGSANLTVTTARLELIVVTPANSKIAKGSTQQFIATGTFTDGSTHDITSSVIWDSSDPGVVVISNEPGNNGLATGESTGTTVIRATSGMISGGTNLTVTSAVLTSISVTPVGSTIARGITQQYTATGIYSDNSTQDLTNFVDWSTSSSNTATISNTGLATGVNQGTVTITATSGTIFGTVNLTVTTATLQSIAVTPTTPQIAKGTSQQFIATGTFTDGSTYDITSSVTWSSSIAGIATISNSPGSNGLATAGTTQTGPTLITAMLGLMSGSTSLTVTGAVLQSISVTPGNAAIPQGTSQSFSATGIYSDGSTQNITNNVIWSTSDSTIATISSTGVAQSSNKQNSVIITASSGTISGTANLTVTRATLQSIAVTPATSQIAKGTTQQFIATGTFTDGSTYDITSSVTWSSSSPDLATISNNPGSNGLATAGTNQLGSTNITATLGMVSGSANLTLTSAVLKSINVTPVSSAIAQGVTQQYTATGIYSDGTTQIITNNVTWSTSDSTIVTISTTGLVTSIAQGTVTVTATSGTILGTASLTVTTATLQSIAVTPITPQIAKGTTQQFIATGTFTDGSTYNITSSVTWNSSIAGIATISNSPGFNGLATAGIAQTGPTIITATLGMITGNTSLTVTDAVLTSIDVTPENAAIAQGLTVQFTATGIYSDGSTQIITNNVIWSTSDSTIATISSTGVAKSYNKQGSVAITATSGTISGAANLTVTAARLISIGVQPGNAQIASGTSVQYIGTGVYSDGSESNITSSVTWTSSNTAVATIISNQQINNGLATGGTTTGSTSINAALGTISGGTGLTVTGAVLTSISITPSSVLIADGITQQFVATGHYSDASTQDISNSVAWSTTDSSIANITNTGLATGLNNGTVTITATSGTIFGTATLNVTNATLLSITLAPVNPTIPSGTSQQFTATGVFSDSSMYDLTSTVTWSSSNEGVAIISNNSGNHGLATGEELGSTTITAKLNTISGSTNLTVQTGFTLGGTVTGLTIGSGYSVTLQNSGGDNLLIDTNGTFTFPGKFLAGASYGVTVLFQPTGQQCNVIGGSGTFSGNVDTVSVQCNAVVLSDSFRGASASLPWITLIAPGTMSQACLTAGTTGAIPACPAGTEGGLNGNTPDTAGNGTLRLTTTNPTFQGSGIIETDVVATAQGLSLDFTVYSYSNNVASGADGISFMIINADNGTPPSSLGCQGSGLGYDTIQNGYVGIGLDEYGNFAKSPVCASGTPTNPNNIGIRGATTSDSSTTNPYIIGNMPPQTTVPMWQKVSIRSAATPLLYHIIITNQGIVSVFLNGIPYLAGINAVTDPESNPIPSNLYFGFAASTGTHYNIHEIQDFSISIPTTTNLDLALQAIPNPLIVNASGQSYTFTIRNTGGLSSSGTIQLFDNNFPSNIKLAGALSLSGPGADGAILSGCNSLAGSTSIGSNCKITGAKISSVPSSNYLVVNVPISVSSSPTDVTYNASINGGNDLGCSSQIYSPYLCSGTATVSINP